MIGKYQAAEQDPLQFSQLTKRQQKAVRDYKYYSDCAATLSRQLTDAVRIKEQHAAKLAKMGVCTIRAIKCEISD